MEQKDEPDNTDATDILPDLCLSQSAVPVVADSKARNLTEFAQGQVPEDEEMLVANTEATTLHALSNMTATKAPEGSVNDIPVL